MSIPARAPARAFNLATAVSDFSFNKLVIFGVGLIGGSLARALRERGTAQAGRVIGVGRSP
ncbi:prephenate dehydrogenase/arogenate dehydrogenase family protein, partial [Burkholderia sp. Tr-860]|nr:prephenate dehydrogenase/arogenate dehydrogenase family protein [Burkholderia sp. Tr-860]